METKKILGKITSLLVYSNYLRHYNYYHCNYNILYRFYYLTKLNITTIILL
jgi:hypothetical protein